jgi:hypothetical protein
MRKIKILFLLLVLGTFGCESFLNEKAFDTYTTDNFPVSEADAEALVNEMYQEAGEIYGARYLWLSELPSEMVTTKTNGSDRRAQMDNYTVVNSNDYIARFWEDSYQTIKQANAVIALYEGETTIDATLATRLVAESRVIRANTYFNLATFFGDVPLILDRISSLETTAHPISSLTEVYGAIISDLTQAEPDLPFIYSEAWNQGRVTRGAARALLGKVYLQRAAEPRSGIGLDQDYQEALKWLRLVRDNDGGTNYKLEPHFVNLFGLENLESSKFSNEIVFQLWRDGADCCDNFVHQHIVAQDAEYGSRRWGNMVGEVPFYLSYYPTDERFWVTFLDTIETSTGLKIYDVNNPGTDGFKHDGAPYTKGVDINSPDASGGNNIFLIRYADVLLMIAEAENEVNNGPNNDAYNAINSVRGRSRTIDSELVDYADLSYAEFREAVFNERRWELAFEGHGLRDGHRFLDIFKARVENAPNYVEPKVPAGIKEDGGRLHDAVPEVQIHVTSDNIRFPIPLTEIDTNTEINE